MNIRRFTALSAIACLLALFAFFMDKESGNPSESEEIVLGSSSGVGSALIWIAHKQGYFRDEELNITIRKFAYGKTAVQALIEHEVDLAIATEFVLAKNLAAGERQLRALTVISVSRDIQMIFSPASAISNFTDIRDKTIGVSKGSNAEYFLAQRLSLQGIDESEVKTVHLIPDDMAAALVNAEVDAVVTWEPHAHRLKQTLGESAAILDRQAGQNYYVLLMSHIDWIQCYPNRVKRILKAIKRAEKWFYANKSTGLKMIRQHYHIVDSSIVDEGGKNHFFSFLPESLIVALNAQIDWLDGKSTTIRQQPINPLDAIYTDALESIEPSAVSVNR